jgi:hypothetical protein
VYGGTGTLTGGDPTAAVVGNDLNYSGGAETVVGVGTSGNVQDSANGAQVGIQGTGYTVVLSGNDDFLRLDSGSSANVTVTGADAVIDLGAPSTTSSGAASAANSTVTSVNTIDISASIGVDTVNAVAGTNNFINVASAADINASGGSDTVNLTAGALTLNATGGNQLVFDNIGGSLINAGPATEYVSAADVATSTVISSAGGNDTVFALSGIDYDGAAAASALFLGSNTDAVTVSAATNATLFGGAAGGVYTEGADSAGGFFLWGHSFGASDTVTASDTVVGGATAAQVTVWGNNNEDVTVSQQGSAAAGAGGTFVAWGASDTINATDARGGNAFIAWNASLPSGTNFTGDTTLIGSNAGSDDFAIFSSSTAQSSLIGASAAHTITIDNWQASDVLFLGGYSAADIATADTALAAADGGSASFTLSDGTTVKFDNVSPTSAFHL